MRDEPENHAYPSATRATSATKSAPSHSRACGVLASHTLWTGFPPSSIILVLYSSPAFIDSRMGTHLCIKITAQYRDLRNPDILLLPQPRAERLERGHDCGEHARELGTCWRLGRKGGLRACAATDRAIGTRPRVRT